MSLQQTIADSLQQLQNWLRFLEAERARLQDEIRRVEARASNDDIPHPSDEVNHPSPLPKTEADAEEVDEWL